MVQSNLIQTEYSTDIREHNLASMNLESYLNPSYVMIKQ